MSDDELPLLESQESCIRILESTLKEVREGVVDAVVVIAFHPDDKYRMKISSHRDVHEMAGLLLEAAMFRLGQG